MVSKGIKEVSFSKRNNKPSILFWWPVVAHVMESGFSGQDHIPKDTILGEGKEKESKSLCATLSSASDLLDLLS